MQTILELLSEIRWHPDIEPKEYRIAYYDRVAKKLFWFEFPNIDFEKSDKFALAVRDGTEIFSLPLHRVRQVKKGENLVWKREVKLDVYRNE